MPTLESRIDELYRAPLGEFIALRTALAKTLAGDEARRVKALAKPTVVPWAANQVYWRARAVYDRLIKAGEKLREAQVAALGGKKADVRGATEAHRKAIADAVHQAEKIAADEGAHPAADGLMRTFEGISMAPDSGEAPGRWTKPLQPAGFEALAGVKVAPAIEKKLEGQRQKEKAKAKEKEAAIEAARRQHEEEIREAEAALERAKRKMAEAEALLKKKRER